MNTATVRALYAMCAILALSLLMIGTIGGFWAAMAYTSGLALACYGYHRLVVCRPRLVCVPVHTLTGIYLYREVARG